MKAIRKLLLAVLCLVTLFAAVLGLNACDDNVTEECPHAWAAWETIVSPTCLAEGIEQRVCRLDSTHTETRPVAKLDHSYETYESNNDATCAKDGTKTAYCSTLGCTSSKVVEDYGSQLAHNFTEKIIDDDYLLRAASCKPATYYYSCYCGACGTETFAAEGTEIHDFKLKKDENAHWYECTACGTKKDVAAHSWGDAYATLPDCTEDGITTYTCKVCGESYVDDALTVPAHHTLVFVAEKASTCQTNGNIAYWQCSVCDLKFSDSDAANEITETVLAKVDHIHDVFTYDEEKHAKKCVWCDSTVDVEEHTMAASFDETHHFLICECGYITSEVLHNIEVQNDKNIHWDECTECKYVSEKTAHTTAVRYSAAQHWEYCSYCGYEFEKFNHVYDAGVVTLEPTCTEYGVKTYTCACGSSYTERISPRHTISDELVPTVDSSCTETGTKAHYICTACGKMFSNKLGMTEDFTIPLKSHTWFKNFANAEGHWTECSECGYKVTDGVSGEVIITPHTLVASVGDELHHYDVCECDYKENIMEHIWNEGVITTPAECFSEGERTYSCFCGQKKYEVVSSHTLTLVEAKAPTGCEDGNIAYLRCETCTNTYYAPGATAENHDHLTIADIIIYASHNFEGGEVGYDETGHYTKCNDCDCVTATTPHSPERIGPEEDGHFYLKCKDCEYKKLDD